MKKFYRPAALALGVALVSAPAFAADVVYQEPPAPAAPMEIAPVATWTGPYAGVSVGYGFEGSTDLPGVGIDTDGWMGGAFGGYQVQNGSLVYGAEADINYSRLGGTVEDPAGDYIESRTTVDGSLRGRLGVTVTEDILLYGTAGLAAERQRISVGTAAGEIGRDTNVALGYTVGAGVDARLTDQVFARAEYRYTDYGSETYEIGGTSFDADSKNHRVSVGLGVKF